MKDLLPTENKELNEDEIDLSELFKVIYNGKYLVGLITSVITIFSIFYALSLPNIYRSEILLAPSEDGGGISKNLQSISGLAGLAGINLSEGVNTKSTQALEVLRSREFFALHILPNIFLPDLMANPSWNPQKNVLMYDSSLYDKENNKWVRDVGFPYKVIPTIQESHNYFLEHVLTIDNNEKTGFITLSIDHVSPFTAKNWANLMVSEVNLRFRNRDLESAMSSIDYINNQMVKTNMVEVRQVLSELLQNQLQKYMLTEANKDYVFTALDPAIAPEKKNSPKRSSIVIFASLIGGFLGILIVLFRHYAWGVRRG